VGRLDGKVAFITGAARGQGRSHAERLADEGADIIGVDVCADMETVHYPLGTAEELAATEKAVQERGRRAVMRQADVRDRDRLATVVREGVDELGRLDIVVANAGIAPLGLDSDDLTVWQDVIDVNLTGVFNTVRVAVPHVIAGGRGGAIVLTSSTAGLKAMGSGTGGVIAYAASKHGMVGIMREFAKTLAPQSIRVNTVHPTGVATPMVQNEVMDKFLSDPDVAAMAAGAMQNLLPVELLDPADVANAVAWLVSDDARYVTGVTLPVDAGLTVK
jgi:SDR family mycofactocin-dependent oxidoreductase